MPKTRKKIYSKFRFTYINKYQCLILMAQVEKIQTIYSPSVRWKYINSGQSGIYNNTVIRWFLFKRPCDSETNNITCSRNGVRTVYII